MNSLLLSDDEIWKPVADYEDYYLVSSFGRIKSIRADKILSTTGHDKIYGKIPENLEVIKMF